jgi:hypothetical protein
VIKNIKKLTAAELIILGIAFGAGFWFAETVVQPALNWFFMR